MRTPPRRVVAAFLFFALGPGLVWGQVAGSLPRTASPAPAPAIAPPSAARAALVSFDGFVEVQRAGASRRQTITELPLGLGDGDKIHTYRKGKAVVRFADGSQVELGPYSIFTIEEQKPGRIGLFLSAGKLWAMVSKLKDRRFEVRTPTAVASVRGTEFFVESDKTRTAVEVFGGLVAVRGALGDELLLGAQQRVDVLEGRMGRLERFEGSMEERQRQDARGEKKEARREERGEAREGERLKAALEREVGFQLQREAVESAAAFEMKNALYQEGKTLIDAFGQRVRVEEYITRPNPATFKFVTLNFREGRLDRGLFEVTANAALPQDLGSVNLWYSPTAAKPSLYAVKQRWVISNGVDSAVEMAVDGDSRQVTFRDEPVFDPSANGFVSPQPRTEHVTVFGNIYEFLNGDSAQMSDIWSGTLRPNNGSGMMWHMVPFKVAVRDATGCPGACNNTILGEYWDYGFATRTGVAGATGKMFVDKSFAPEPFLAHFVNQRSYIDFTDNNANGILDFGESITAAADPDNPFGVPIYEDKTNRLDASGNEIAFAGAGTLQTVTDTAFFSDKDGNGVADDGLNFTFTGSIGGDFADLFAFGHNNPRDWSRSDDYTIDDEGHIFDFRTLFTSGLGTGTGADAQTQAAHMFERLNFEHVLTSNRFAGRKIDVVMTPRLLLKAGLIDGESGGDSLEN